MLHCKISARHTRAGLFRCHILTSGPTLPDMDGPTVSCSLKETKHLQYLSRKAPRAFTNSKGLATHDAIAKTLERARGKLGLNGMDKKNLRGRLNKSLAELAIRDRATRKRKVSAMTLQRHLSPESPPASSSTTYGHGIPFLQAFSAG